MLTHFRFRVNLHPPTARIGNNNNSSGLQNKVMTSNRSVACWKQGFKLQFLIPLSLAGAKEEVVMFVAVYYITVCVYKYVYSSVYRV